MIDTRENEVSLTDLFFFFFFFLNLGFLDRSFFVRIEGAGQHDDRLGL